MDAEHLLADAAWLRRLASSLAGEGDADDLVQESWLAAWRKQPAGDRPLRPWLAKVVRDLAAMRRRGDRRRLVRELAAIDDREAPTPDAMLEQVRLHRLLADLVLALAEPYRSTIVARFFEGKSAADIARKLGIPDATVRARVREGLSRLRAELDRETGDRKAWAAVALRGGFHVAKSSKVVWIVAALIIGLLLGGGSFIVHRGARSEILVARGETAVWVRRSDATPTLAIVEPTAGRRIAGRVLVDGQPVAGARVRLVGAATDERTTDGAGRFDFGAMPKAAYAIGAIVPGRLAEVQAIDTRDPALHADALELVLLPCEASLVGHVTDPSGAPIANAEVLREDVIGVVTDAQGHYELCIRRVALTNEELRTIVRATGYAAIEVITTAQGHRASDFVLEPETVVRGRVVDEEGVAIAEASVRVTALERRHRGAPATADATATSDDTGAFVVRGLDGGTHHFVARAPGMIGAVDADTAPVAITLHPAASVRGRISPARGGVTVKIGDATAPTAEDGSFAIDDVIPGDTTASAAPYRLRAAKFTLHAGPNDLVLEIEPFVTVRGTVRLHGVGASARVIVADGSDYHAAYTDADGLFVFPGMAAGHYTGVADTQDAYAELDWTIGSVDTTRDVELAGAIRISGIVVDRANAPVANAVVRFERSAGSQWDRGRCTTDATGAFSCGHMAGGTYRPRVFFSENGQPELHLDHDPIVLAGNVDHIRLVVDGRRLDIRGTVTGESAAYARVFATNGHEANVAPLATTIADEHGLFRIADLSPGTYSVEAHAGQAHGLVIADAGGVANIAIGRCELAHAVAPGTRPTQRTTWDDRVELLGWDAPVSIKIGEPLTVTLYLKALQPFDAAYDVFVHGTGEHRWLNADHALQSGRCTTAAWQPGEVIVDRFTIPTALDFNGRANQPGDFALDVGLFRGERRIPAIPAMPIATVRFE